MGWFGYLPDCTNRLWCAIPPDQLAVQICTDPNYGGAVPLREENSPAVVLRETTVSDNHSTYYVFVRLRYANAFGSGW